MGGVPDDTASETSSIGPTGGRRVARVLILVVVALSALALVVYCTTFGLRGAKDCVPLGFGFEHSSPPPPGPRSIDYSGGGAEHVVVHASRPSSQPQLRGSQQEPRDPNDGADMRAEMPPHIISNVVAQSAMEPEDGGSAETNPAEVAQTAQPGAESEDTVGQRVGGSTP
mmetsp:Transcript_94058/g.242979  ORF Transcript_94058/g.242979 Transcript_94058/m.242979 type:complete len:170 (-) Transcript_94058:85-594(-)